MNTESQIDAALRRMGSAEPPMGLEHRVLARLDEPGRRFLSMHTLSAFAIAASLAVGVVALGPLVENINLHHASATAGSLPRVMVPVKRTFGTASAMNVPSAPLPLAAAPVNHGRGHVRPGRTLLPSGSAPGANAIAVPSRTAGQPPLSRRIHAAPATDPAIPLP